jgi:hypothetical protein
MKNFFEKKSYTKLLSILAVLLIAWIVFSAGMFVGYHKAAFSLDRDDLYRKGFGSPDSPFAPFMHGSDDVNPHGAMGQIVSVNFPLLMIKSPGNAEQIIILSSSTTIRLLHGMASTSDIKAGQYAITVGEPNDKGEVQASFIRIIPAPQNQ